MHRNSKKRKNYSKPKTGRFILIVMGAIVSVGLIVALSVYAITSDRFGGGGSPPANVGCCHT
ncbi:MAG: hypothetical protein FWB72_02050 [Firmicutes bacterium]|nr:hypothetical protein [Bacillota bacterium]